MGSLSVARAEWDGERGVYRIAKVGNPEFVPGNEYSIEPSEGARSNAVLSSNWNGGKALPASFAGTFEKKVGNMALFLSGNNRWWIPLEEISKAEERNR